MIRQNKESISLLDPLTILDVAAMPKPGRERGTTREIQSSSEFAPSLLTALLCTRLGLLLLPAEWPKLRERSSLDRYVSNDFVRVEGG